MGSKIELYDLKKAITVNDQESAKRYLHAALVMKLKKENYEPDIAESLATEYLICFKITLQGPDNGK